ncbi:hypothetical protein VNI00_007970 [Paramarasmius palmivorus]|uniref:Angiogenic factor with G patch and FHA domains 1 n=1 Tax=Paramarasmius palmivorus TaxID=297713 RepID=A0AAW0D1B7_9AGAR
MEPGELQETSGSSLYSRPCDSSYDRSYEWPWDSPSQADSDTQAPLLNNEVVAKSNTNKRIEPAIRLLVIHTRILPKLHRIALLDGYEEVQLGRDSAVNASYPKIRLKEMEVSKLHATIYWDKTWKRWGIVDMGSKHGTFLRSAISSSSELDMRGTRLSGPKTASIPRRLCHLDELTIGSTTFVVHIHDDGLPCEECSPGQTGNEIPLFPSPKTRTTSKIDGNTSTQNAELLAMAGQRRSKTALSQLKRQLLTRHDGGEDSIAVASQRYVDRSARRRALYPSSHSDTPGIANTPPTTSSTRLAAAADVEAHEPVASQPVPLPASNLGHKLLVKQGWMPGTSLGMTEEGRVDPLDIKFSSNRAGLGSMRSTSTSGSAQDGWSQHRKG